MTSSVFREKINSFANDNPIKPLRDQAPTESETNTHTDSPPETESQYALLPIQPHSKIKDNIGPRPLIPFHERLKNYYQVRGRIFNNKNKPSRSSLRIREFWRNVRCLKKTFSVSILDRPGDIRPYAEVQLLGKNMIGLLDTGASISCLGSQAASDFLTSMVPYKALNMSVKTADGKSQRVLGILDTEIVFRGKLASIKMYIVPTLSQNLILGIDFWRLYDLLPPSLLPFVGQSDQSDGIDEIFGDKILSPQQKFDLQKVITLFPSFAKEGLGRTNVLCHSIDTGNAKPVKQRHFPVSPAIEKLMYDELDRMLSLGVIEESSSAWSSPVVLHRKPGKNRLCLDSRKLNSLTVGDAYPLPHIDGILSRLPKAEFISSLDLKDAFWQIPLDKSSKDKTAFTIPGRPLYHFKVMPFGLCNAPQTMCRLMDRVIPASLRTEVFVYLDDLLVVSPTFERHLEVLMEVSKCLRNSGLTINVEKSKFCVTEVRYLGHVVGNGVIQTDPDKIAAITEFPTPRSVKQVRRFLGMSGWYRKFIKNYAALSAPLSDLVKANRRFVWTEEAQKAFEGLKSILSSAPVLHSPDFSQPFYIHCDASKTGIGAVLVQKNAEGDEIPIAFMSRKLNQAQRNYSVTEQECLAAMLSIKKFRAYVEGHEFTVITDHASLKWLMSQTDLSTRLARWALKLQGYRFNIEHRKGSQNVVPDTLSRANTDDLSEVLCVSELGNDSGVFVDINSAHFNSEDYKKLLERVRNNIDATPDLKIIDGFLYRRTEHAIGEQTTDDMAWKLWIPQSLIPELLKKHHDDPLSSHCGINKTLERIRRYYFWPNLVNDVKNYINACEKCKTTKHPNKIMRPPMGNTGESHRFFQKLYVDFLGPYPRSRSGNIGIFVVLDHFSKFSFIHPVKRFTADVVIKFLEEHLFHIFGVPEIIVSDNGTQFKANKFNDLLKKYGISHVYTAVHSPQANASERVNRSVISAIKAYVSQDQKDWDENLSRIACALRSTIHSSVGTSPYFMAFGQHMVTNGSTYKLLRNLSMLEDRTVNFNRADSFDVIRNKAAGVMRKQFERNERAYNLRSREVSYEVGQEVFRRNFRQSNFEQGYNAKLAPTFVRARIRQKLGNCYYELEDLQGRSIGNYHAKDIRQ